MSRYAAVLGVLVFGLGAAGASKKRNRPNRQSQPPPTTKRDEARGHDNHSLGKDHHFGSDRSGGLRARALPRRVGAITASTVSSTATAGLTRL